MEDPIWIDILANIYIYLNTDEAKPWKLLQYRLVSRKWRDSLNKNWRAIVGKKDKWRRANVSYKADQWRTTLKSLYSMMQTVKSTEAEGKGAEARNYRGWIQWTGVDSNYKAISYQSAANICAALQKNWDKLGSFSLDMRDLPRSTDNIRTLMQAVADDPDASEALFEHRYVQIQDCSFRTGMASTHKKYIIHYDRYVVKFHFMNKSACDWNILGWTEYLKLCIDSHRKKAMANVHRLKRKFEKLEPAFRKSEEKLVTANKELRLLNETEAKLVSNLQSTTTTTNGNSVGQLTDSR